MTGRKKSNASRRSVVRISASFPSPLAAGDDDRSVWFVVLESAEGGGRRK